MKAAPWGWHSISQNNQKTHKQQLSKLPLWICPPIHIQILFSRQLFLRYANQYTFELSRCNAKIILISHYHCCNFDIYCIFIFKIIQWTRRLARALKFLLATVFSFHFLHITEKIPKHKEKTCGLFFSLEVEQKCLQL